MTTSVRRVHAIIASVSPWALGDAYMAAARTGLKVQHDDSAPTFAFTNQIGPGAFKNIGWIEWRVDLPCGWSLTSRGDCSGADVAALIDLGLEHINATEGYPLDFVLGALTAPHWFHTTDAHGRPVARAQVCRQVMGHEDTRGAELAAPIEWDVALLADAGATTV